MQGFSDPDKRSYIEESQQILDACRGANPALETALTTTIN
jgi:hypothetical protein